MSLFIHTDGGNSSKNLVGACAAVVHIDEQPIVELVESYEGPQVTNNTMELAGVLLGLCYILDHPELGKDVVIVSDSEYIVKGASTWLRVWKMKKWKTTTGLVKNQPVWVAIDELSSKLNIEWRWVRGHTGDKWNERADELCTAAYEALLTKQQTEVS